MKITKDSRRLVLAMAFSDGYLNASGYMSVRHCVSQKEYLEWKKHLLNKHGIHTTDIYYVTNNGYGAYEFRTIHYDFIKVLRRRLYKPSKKKAQISILKNFTPLHLAIWYMDDGSLSQRKRNGKIISNELFLNTYISYEDNQIIQDYFANRWNIQFTINKSKSSYRLRCGTHMARCFVEIIRPYVEQVPCMLYKIDVKPDLSKAISE